jgi:hypothetical protein
MAMLTRRRTTWAWVLAMILLGAISRTASADEPATAVRGTMRVNGKPLFVGRIFFHLDDGEFVGSQIKDGKYKISHVPAGKWRVSVEAIDVPPRFASEEQTPLQVSVKAGSNVIDFDLRS